MSKHLERTLYKAAALTFEELGFILPTPELDEQQASALPDVTVNVGFDGPFAGQLAINICGSLLPLLASNMLGEDGIPALEQQHDGLREIANVICGNMLPGIAGSKLVFHIRPARILEKKLADQLLRTIPVAEVSIGLNEGRAELRLFLDCETLVQSGEECRA